MGYLTTFSLSVENADIIKRPVHGVDSDGNPATIYIEEEIDEYNLFKEVTGTEYPDDSMKWYDHHEDMLKFSQKYPDLLFRLGGMGEEAGDIWIKYYQNGKSQVCKARITFDEYDENKMC